MNLADVTVFLIDSLLDQITSVFLKFNYAIDIRALKECTNEWVEKGGKGIYSEQISYNSLWQPRWINAERVSQNGIRSQQLVVAEEHVFES